MVPSASLGLSKVKGVGRQRPPLGITPPSTHTPFAFDKPPRNTTTEGKPKMKTLLEMPGWVWCDARSCCHNRHDDCSNGNHRALYAFCTVTQASIFDLIAEEEIGIIPMTNAEIVAATETGKPTCPQCGEVAGVFRRADRGLVCKECAG